MRVKKLKKTGKKLTTLDQILDKKYGKRRAKKREKWEQEFETFRRDELGGHLKLTLRL